MMKFTGVHYTMYRALHVLSFTHSKCTGIISVLLGVNKIAAQDEGCYFKQQKSILHFQHNPAHRPVCVRLPLARVVVCLGPLT